MWNWCNLSKQQKDILKHLIKVRGNCCAEHSGVDCVICPVLLAYRARLMKEDPCGQLHSDVNIIYEVACALFLSSGGTKEDIVELLI